MRVAVLSDVHGNALALDAVLADIATQGVDATLCLGDHVSGPMDPAGVAERLMTLDGPIISGNHDRWVVEPRAQGQGKVDQFAASRLSRQQHQWLAALPATAVFNDDIFLCHGTPASDEQHWIDDFYADRTMTLPSEESIVMAAAGVDYPIMLCGHTHLARSVRLRDGRRIINPGAVGFQLVHGSPDARYAVIELRQGKWSTALRVVEYDHDAAAAQAVANGFDGWAEVLTSGWAPSAPF
ncbi:metallophosphoesterase family protein [Devosia beringensis]|uniref:metallophosphoesterase family protein n=1 Tax=Devosia beringensis TaxID=2657486 RepID=UPI00186B961F|nr:metallophosphoesterase family protein [Devosia beringensis]